MLRLHPGKERRSAFKHLIRKTLPNSYQTLISPNPGWSEDEAVKIFVEISAARGGVVGLPEFQAWWQGMEGKVNTVPALNT
jgi:hypothetical protein